MSFPPGNVLRRQNQTCDSGSDLLPLRLSDIIARPSFMPNILQYRLYNRSGHTKFHQLSSTFIKFHQLSSTFIVICNHQELRLHRQLELPAVVPTSRRSRSLRLRSALAGAAADLQLLPTTADAAGLQLLRYRGTGTAAAAEYCRDGDVDPAAT